MLELLSQIKPQLIDPLIAWYRLLRAKSEVDPGGSMSLKALQREPVHFELDIPYTDTDNPRQQLDIYLPIRQKPGKKLPVIVFFHGGGWMMGNKSDGAGRLLPFVKSGRFAGVSAGYRLSSEDKWPAQLDDARAAIRWIHRHGGEYGLDTDRVIVYGRSAGGHLALMLGMTADGRDTVKVRAVINFFGVTDIPALIGEGGDIDRQDTRAPEAQLIGGLLTEHPDAAKAASPVSYIDKKDVPVLTVHGTDDKTVPYEQAEILHKKLQQAGIENYLVTIVGGGHENFGNVADRRVKAFLKRMLYDKRTRVSTRNIKYSP